MSTIAIVIPTYNAHDTIIDSIQSIKRVVLNALILVVDDNSPDNTSKEVQKVFKNDKQVKIIIRKGKGGRGSAVITGFKEALENKKIKYFIEMDADLCHDPKYIPQLVDKCQKADIIIASKYAIGSTIAGLTLKRKLMSKLMNKAARIMLQVPITDYTNGYRCYSRRAIQFVCGLNMKSRGFIVLSEIVFKCYKNGFTFAEIPFDFRQVTVGTSNLNTREIREALMTLFRIRFEK